MTNIVDGYLKLRIKKGREMYKVKGKTFDSFMKAMRYAQSIKAEVFEVETGLRRWAPADPISAKRMRRYENQKAAYEAQERFNNA